MIFGGKESKMLFWKRLREKNYEKDKSDCSSCSSFVPFLYVRSAEWITVNISGQITSVDDPYNHFGAQISIGEAITGTYTYDSQYRFVPGSERALICV